MYNTIGNGGPEGNVGSFQYSWYWSSSENNSDYAWLVDFDYGNPNDYGKHYTLRVRVIRAFGNWTMGCMDETACNYNPDANMADGSCIYPEQGYDCDGNIIAQVGDLIEGGILFYLHHSGERGLVAAIEEGVLT